MACTALTEEHLLTSMYITADEAYIFTPHRPQPVHDPPVAGGLGAGGFDAGGLGAWCRHRHLTKLFVREGLDTSGVPNCSSNICTSGWRLQPAVSVMTPTTPWGFVGVFGAPCAHHATKCLSSGELF